MTGVFVRRHKHTQREDSHVKTEAEHREMKLQAKGCQRLLENTRSLEDPRKDAFLESSGEYDSANTLILGF